MLIMMLAGSAMQKMGDGGTAAGRQELQSGTGQPFEERAAPGTPCPECCS